MEIVKKIYDMTQQRKQLINNKDDMTQRKQLLKLILNTHSIFISIFRLYYIQPKNANQNALIFLEQIIPHSFK